MSAKQPFAVAWEAVVIVGVLLWCLPLLAMEVGLCWAFGAMAFDIAGWTYPARIALVVTSVAVILANGGTLVFDAWAQGRSAHTWEDLIARSWATLVQQDDFGKLWTVGSELGGDPVRVVEVANATPEIDGSYRHYLLRVPPDVRTAREAVAWTFAFENGQEFTLAMES